MNDSIKIGRLIGKAANGDALFIKMYDIGSIKDDVYMFNQHSIKCWVSLDEVVIDIYSYIKDIQ